MHRLEKIWLYIGGITLIVFLTVLGIQTFATGIAPPSHQHSIDPQKLSETPPFDNPGIKQIGKNEYEIIMIAYAFGYTPNEIEIPIGATVHFKVTSPDVVHGFQIPGTNVNMMVLPGQINSKTYTFTKPGTYLILCNEYCGTGHHMMKTTVTVK